MFSYTKNPQFLQTFLIRFWVDYCFKLTTDHSYFLFQFFFHNSKSSFLNDQNLTSFIWNCTGNSPIFTHQRCKITMHYLIRVIRVIRVSESHPYQLQILIHKRFHEGREIAENKGKKNQKIKTKNWQ